MQHLPTKPEYISGIMIICMSEYIRVRGARQHNLKNIDIDIPKNKLVVFTGVSGSGKSSLAFDTIYAEGQRRYVESLSTYARQFLGIMGKPDVDLIEGLSPAISIDQKTTSHNPRSTVGTVTEIYDYMRLLFARAGHPHCPVCGREISSQSSAQISEAIFSLIKSSSEKQIRFMIFAPLVKDRKGEFSALFENLQAKGYKRLRIDGEIHDLDEDFVLIKTNKHTIDVVIDRLTVGTKDLKDEIFVKSLETRINDAVEQGLKLSDGTIIATKILDPGFEMPEVPRIFEDHLFSEKFACPTDNISLPEIEPRTFSFNSPHGACPDCTGLGRILKVDAARILAPELTVREGGVIPYASTFEHDTWLARLILTALRENNIDPNMPIKNYSLEQKKVLLDGTGGRTYRVEGTNRQGSMTYITETWPGILKELERRYHTSDSDYIKMSLEKYMSEVICDSCLGARLKPEALGITINSKNISEITNLAVKDILVWAENLQKGTVLSGREMEVASLVLKEIIERLNFLINVGLDYLTISRAANTLSGGEAQRIRLASQIGSGLTGVLYVLDEPTIGLHPRDNELLIATLKKLRDLGNTVVVVEHDRDVMSAADYIFDFGPGAGKHGGVVITEGDPETIKNDENSITGKYLSGRRQITFPKSNRANGSYLTLFGANQFNLKNIDVAFPLGKFVAVTGVSGSGKSTLVVETLSHAIAKSLNKYHREPAEKYIRVEGVEQVDKVVLIDQAPIGRTPRSNPATYTKVFDLIRDVFANTREAKASGYKKGRFSFNVKGGRCEVCEGQGKIKIEMQFMPDIWVDCEVCHGARYASSTLEVTYKGKNIAEVLGLTVEEAIEFFHVFKNITSKLETLKAVGLDYMELGQAATTLSGGEAQRVKLATELSKKSTGKTVYILDEPTTGLHFSDLEKLVAVLKILVDRGNTVIVIEHNLDVIKNADWIIELGPEGGELGGRVVASGPPSEIVKSQTYTGKFLKDINLWKDKN